MLGRILIWVRGPLPDYVIIARTVQNFHTKTVTSVGSCTYSHMESSNPNLKESSGSTAVPDALNHHTSYVLSSPHLVAAAPLKVSCPRWEANMCYETDPTPLPPASQCETVQSRAAPSAIRCASGHQQPAGKEHVLCLPTPYAPIFFTAIIE